MNFTDENNKIISLNVIEPGKKFSLQDKRYGDYIISTDSGIITIHKGASSFRYVFLDNKVKFIYNGKYIDLTPVEKWGFEGNEKWATMRGYIWSRSFPSF